MRGRCACTGPALSCVHNAHRSVVQMTGLIVDWIDGFEE